MPEPKSVDPVSALCAVIEKLVGELAQRSERDARLIKALVDTVILHGNADLQTRRIELETVGTAQSKAADAYRLAIQRPDASLNGTHEEGTIEIPGRA